jgi:hypothetical protein
MSEEHGRSLLAIVGRYNRAFDREWREHQDDIIDEACLAVDHLILLAGQATPVDQQLIETAHDVMRFIVARKKVPFP